MSSLLRRIFGRSRIEMGERPAHPRLPAAPDPDDLFDWSPRAKPEDPGAAAGHADAEVPSAAPSASKTTPPVAPISEALSQFKAQTKDVSPSMPPPPPPPATKPAQIRLLMADGTVVELAGDPELRRRIGYLAENLLAPRHPSEDGGRTLASVDFLPDVGDSSMPEPAAEATVAQRETGVVPDSAGTMEGGDPEPPPARRPQMRLVFSDGSEAAIPPDQEIVDRLAYVMANLLEAQPGA